MNDLHTLEDAAAIRRMKSGDMGGLESLVERYQVRAVRAAYFITYDEALAQDIVQDVFLRIYHSVQRFDEARPFGPYLMQSVVNASLNSMRHSKKTVSLEGSPESFERLLSRAASTESQVEFNQQKKEILKALFQLSPRQRAVIVQRYYLEMSEQEMASKLEVAPGTIKWLLNAARGRLKQLLAPERSEP